MKPFSHIVFLQQHPLPNRNPSKTGNMASIKSVNTNINYIKQYKEGKAGDFPASILVSLGRV